MLLFGDVVDGYDGGENDDDDKFNSV